MSRSAVYSALVLRSRPSGESNSEVFLLTGEEGIIRATVFGGAKSKLRAYAAPYNSGQVWIYRDKSKDYGKLSDFDVKFWRAGLRELYDRTMAAAAVADTILSSHGGGGEWDVVLKLAIETLDALENANEELCGRLLVHFLWQWADFLGIQPHIEECGGCSGGSFSSSVPKASFLASSVPKDANGDKNELCPLWYNIREGVALCADCVSSVPRDVPREDLNELCPQPALSLSTSNNANKPNKPALSPTSSVIPGFIKLNPGSQRWLSVTGKLESSAVYRFSMDNRSFGEAKALVTAVLTSVLGKKLSSWEW